MAGKDTQRPMKRINESKDRGPAGAPGVRRPMAGLQKGGCQVSAGGLGHSCCHRIRSHAAQHGWLSRASPPIASPPTVAAPAAAGTGSARTSGPAVACHPTGAAGAVRT